MLVFDMKIFDQEQVILTNASRMWFQSQMRLDYQFTLSSLRLYFVFGNRTLQLIECTSTLSHGYPHKKILAVFERLSGIPFNTSTYSFGYTSKFLFNAATIHEAEPSHHGLGAFPLGQLLWAKCVPLPYPWWLLKPSLLPHEGNFASGEIPYIVCLWQRLVGLGFVTAVVFRNVEYTQCSIVADRNSKGVEIFCYQASRMPQRS